MDAENADVFLSKVAGAIAEPARARMLCCLLDGHARTSTELAVVAEVSPSTASAHLARLKEHQLVHVVAQGKHRYYQLSGSSVAAALEALLVVAGLPRPTFSPNTPPGLRNARTCYDHMAGTLGVAVHDRLIEHGFLVPLEKEGTEYELTPAGVQVMKQLGVDVDAARKLRRRFACACLDWSERRPHIGGALGAALLEYMARHGWIEHDLDSRALTVTRKGRRRLAEAFGI